MKEREQVEALSGISLEVREGEIFGLIGRNGAGKTTLVKIIATLVQPTEGTVNVRDFDSICDDGRVRASRTRQRRGAKLLPATYSRAEPHFLRAQSAAPSAKEV